MGKVRIACTEDVMRRETELGVTQALRDKIVNTRSHNSRARFEKGHLQKHPGGYISRKAVLLAISDS